MLASTPSPCRPVAQPAVAQAAISKAKVVTKLRIVGHPYTILIVAE
jgi:hypothetical protein